MEKGKLVVIVAPSGTGKTTLLARVKADFHQIEESISYTTRPIRPGEVDGINYFYISKKEFLEMKENDEFLEWAEVHGNFYGTSKAFVHKRVNQGRNLLFDLDVQGCDSMKEEFPDSYIIFIEPPSHAELEKRLRGRGTESTDIIEIRLNNAKKELERRNDYDYLVLNDDVEKGYKRLSETITEILEK